MKAITIHPHTPHPRLQWQDVDDLTPADDEVLVAVQATAVNRADLMQADGHYPPPAGASPILGLEMAGIITAIGANVTDWAIGDRVCALLPGGGYAQQVTVPADMLLRLPDERDFEWGTAVPEAWLTAYVNLFIEGHLQADETVLIHAGASGVGTAAIQLARAAGAHVAVTASQPKHALCRQLGAETVIDYKSEAFAERLGDNSVDLILDMIGGAYLGGNTAVLRPFGRLINISFLSGAMGQLNMAHLLRKRLTIVGSTLRGRPLAEKIAITHAFRDRFWPLLCDGTLHPVIDRAFPITQAQTAHQFMRDNRNAGKLVLTIE